MAAAKRLKIPKEAIMGDERKWKKRLTWISLILIIVVVVLPLGLLATGYIYQTIASKSDWERYPPPGELIDLVVIGYT
jgi:flagellar basal body-associated protein FliL